MPNLDTWITGDSDGYGWVTIDESTRAVMAWRRIMDRPSTIRVHGQSVDQVVRIERDDTASEGDGIDRTFGRQRLVIFGVRNHPDANVPDTDLDRGDRIFYDNASYEVVVVIKTPGEIQALSEVKR